jgi:hypothetical protein
MKKSEEEKRAFWLDQMKVGRAKFILRAGILAWGGQVGIGLLVFSIASGQATNHLLRVVIACASCAVVFGGLYGLNLWYYYQKKYR